MGDCYVASFGIVGASAGSGSEVSAAAAIEMGLRIAQSLAHPNMLDYISLGDNYFVIEIRPGEVLEDRPLSELNIDDTEVRLLAIKHGQSVSLNPSPDQRLRRNDHLVLVGEEEALRHFSENL